MLFRSRLIVGFVIKGLAGDFGVGVAEIFDIEINAIDRLGFIRRRTAPGHCRHFGFFALLLFVF